MRAAARLHRHLARRKSLTAAALAYSGAVTIQGRIRQPPSPAWMTILQPLGTGAGPHFHLWRFARYCSASGIGPEAVSDATVAIYRDELRTLQPRHGSGSWRGRLPASGTRPPHATPRGRGNGSASLTIAGASRQVGRAIPRACFKRSRRGASGSAGTTHSPSRRMRRCGRPPSGPGDATCGHISAHWSRKEQHLMSWSAREPRAPR